jgi:tetratricopeptide (TPR) repeat protein
MKNRKHRDPLPTAKPATWDDHRQRIAAVKWDWIATALYVFVTGVVSFGFWSVGGYGVETDAFAGYLPDTARLLEGSFTTLDGFKGPGFHIGLAIVGMVVGDLFMAAKLLALGSAAVVLSLVFRMVRQHADSVTAWIVYGLIATNAQFVLYTIQIGTDMYFLALAITTAYLLLKRRGTTRVAKSRFAALAGVLAGLAYLTRYNGLFLLVSGVVIYLLADWKEIPKVDEESDTIPETWRTRFTRTAAFTGAAVLVLLPWSLFTYIKGRGFLYNANYKNIAYEMYGRGVVPWDQFWEYLAPAFSGFGDVLSGHILVFFWTVLRNSVEHFWLDMNRVMGASFVADLAPMVAFIWAALTILGIVITISVNRLRAWPVGVLGLMSYGVLVPVFYGERLSLPMVLWYAVFSASAVVWSARHSLWNVVTRFIPSLALTAAALLGAYSTTVQILNLVQQSPDEIARVVDVIGEPLPDNVRVLARKPHIAWHLGAEFRKIPIIRSISELPDIARENNAQYLFVSSVEAGLRRPLIPLLDPRNAPRFLRPIASVWGRPAVLYEFAFDVPPPPPRVDVYRAPDRTHQPSVTVRIGDGYRRAGNFDFAERYYERASTGDDSTAAQLGLLMIVLEQDNSHARGSSAFLVREDVVDAELSLLQLVDENPTSVVVQEAYGDYLAAQGRITQAIEPYERAVSILPVVASLLAKVARTCDRAGRKEDAGRHWARVVTSLDASEALRMEAETYLGSLDQPAPGN